VYLLVVRIKQPLRFAAGALGEIPLEPGWYIYVGSARRNLNARLARHHRREKKLHWHIDYLLAMTEPAEVRSVPIYTHQDLECRLARDLAAAAAGSVPGFGCSDCRCRSHLFCFESDPLHSGSLLEILLHYRNTFAVQ